MAASCGWSGVYPQVFNRGLSFVDPCERTRKMQRHLWTVVLLAISGASCAATMDVPVASASASPSASRAGASVSGVARGAVERDALDLDVYPRTLFAQGDATVQLRVEPDARSRSLELEWWSDEGGGGAHLITLEGDRAAMRHQYWIRHLEPGEYQVTAVLKRNDGTAVRRAVTVIVAGR